VVCLALLIAFGLDVVEPNHRDGGPGCADTKQAQQAAA